MLVKICGMKSPANLKAVAQLSPNFLGFIFYPPSKRYMEQSLSPADVEHLPPTIQKVGVFVNESEEDIMKRVHRFCLDVVQLHGEESPTVCQRLQQQGISVWKVFHVGTTFNFDVLEAYIPHVDAFLFDTQGTQYGGNGVTFNWGILEEYPFDKPFWLSGGIRPADAEALRVLSFPQLLGVDINSGFENQPGEKNISLLQPFLQTLQNM